MQRLAKKAGWTQPVTNNSLRYTCAERLVADGYSQQLVQILTGRKITDVKPIESSTNQDDSHSVNRLNSSTMCIHSVTPRAGQIIVLYVINTEILKRKL